MNFNLGARFESRVDAPGAFCGLAAIVALCLSGCVSHIARISSARDAVPVQQMPAELLTDPRPNDVPIDFRLLEQPAPATHIIDGGDLLGIIVQGIMPTSEVDMPHISTNNGNNKIVYPALGQPYGPIVGVPMRVNLEGTLPLPLVGSLAVGGLTLRQAAEVIRKAYVVDHRILQPGRDTIIVTLIKPRVHRVMVIREDIPTIWDPSYVWRGTVPYTRRPPSAIIDLPTHQNDVLHALLASGGLPGIDARSEVWVLRGRADGIHPLPPVDAGMSNDPLPSSMIGMRSMRIPLRVRVGEEIAFQPQDILLDDDDIVYVPIRDREVFYTGGLLMGGQYPMPRDRSLNVIEAMALANGGPVGGPAGTLGANLNFVNTALGGTVYPTQVIVFRKLPGGGFIKIAVDLNRAMKDTREAIIIQPDDFVTLQYTPKEYAANFALQMVHFFTFINVPSSSTSAAVASTTGGSQASNGGATETTTATPPPDAGGTLGQ